jgi:hypothetical protein
MRQVGPGRPELADADVLDNMKSIVENEGNVQAVTVSRRAEENNN